MFKKREFISRFRFVSVEVASSENLLDIEALCRSFYNAHMLPFYCSIMFKCIWARNSMKSVVSFVICLERLSASPQSDLKASNLVFEL